MDTENKALRSEEVVRDEIDALEIEMDGIASAEQNLRLAQLNNELLKIQANNSREVVKSLLQYLTDKHLVCSGEFRAAIKHFGITTTYHFASNGIDESFFVDVFAPSIIDHTRTGLRLEFNTAEEASTFSKSHRTDSAACQTIFERHDGTQAQLNNRCNITSMRINKNASWIELDYSKYDLSGFVKVSSCSANISMC